MSSMFSSLIRFARLSASLKTAGAIKKGDLMTSFRLRSLSLFVVFLAALALVGGNSATAAIIDLDGRFGGVDSYSTVEDDVKWSNEHHTAGSIYDNPNNQTTTIRHGVAELKDGTPGEEFYFLFVEVPLYAKNMIWTNQGNPIVNTDPNVGLTEADVAPYRVHSQSLGHHPSGFLGLDFSRATDSEKAVFGSGSGKFEAKLKGDVTNKYGLIASQSSLDYLIDNGISTTDLSLARDTTMSFEFQFAHNTPQNDAILALVRNGIEFHLSPERGLSPDVIPEPSTYIVWSLLMMTFAGGSYWRRKRAAA